MKRQRFSLVLCAALGAMVTIVSPPGAAHAQAPIVQPGAPGNTSRLLSPKEASRLVGVQYTEADVRFLHDMIAHHAQALEMTALIDARSGRDEMRQLARRIALSQESEIRSMRQWLRERGQENPSAGAHQGHLGPGMLTAEEMNQLSQARGLDFDRLFLELMIKHHRGAVTMVDALFDQPGSAQDSQLFALTSDVLSEQTAEMERMGAMLAVVSPDPRIGLRAGFRDAGQASRHLELVATLPKPDGFFDPDAPAGRPDVRAPRPTPRRRPTGAATATETPAGAANAQAARASDAPAGATDRAADAEGADDAGEGRNGPQPRRPSLLDFANSDLAFAGRLVIAGNYHGFNAYDVTDPASPRLVVSVVCPGGQGDVSVYRNLLFMSVEQTRGRLDCGLQGVAERASDARFRGIRIFDISDIRMPRQVAAVQTCRGSHTHTIVNDPGEDGTLYIYGSGSSSVRPSEELADCSDANPAADPNTARFSIDVIAVPLAAPEQARVVGRPRIFADPRTGAIAGLWRGGTHGADTQQTSETNHCHDITAFPELGLAAGACSGNGILLDVSNPVQPIRLDQVVDTRFAYWHSATFNNDGTKVIFTDEWGGGAQPRCRASDPGNWGANAIFDIVDRRLQFRSYFKMPAIQTEQENCVAHNGSLIPIPGRDVMVQAWYQGGISVFDFTDPSRPIEIAFFDRGPLDANRLIVGGHWSAYWHNGFIYGSEISRGLDVLRLLPGEHLTRNEIAAASLVAADRFNPQQQRRVEWPAVPVVARAYLDQLERTRSIASDRVASIAAALAQAESVPAVRGPGRNDVAARLDTVAGDLEASRAGASDVTRNRLDALVETLRGIARDLR
jgi:uncharacterized protein (DUF305 family)